MGALVRPLSQSSSCREDVSPKDCGFLHAGAREELHRGHAGFLFSFLACSHSEEIDARERQPLCVARWAASHAHNQAPGASRPSWMVSPPMDAFLSQLRGVASLSSSADIDGEADDAILRVREIVDVEHGCPPDLMEALGTPALVRALCDAFTNLIALRCKDKYEDDPTQSTLTDLGLIITRVLPKSTSISLSDGSTAGALQAVSKASVRCGLGIADGRRVESGATFYYDPQCVAVGLLLVLHDKDIHPAKTDLDAFAACVDELVRGSGQYVMQSSLVIMLLAYLKKHQGCRAALRSLESRFSALEPPIALTPSASASAAEADPSMWSPRKMLNAFNSYHDEHSKVLTQMPRAIRAFGAQVKISQTSWIDWSLCSRDIMYEVKHDDRKELVFNSDVAAVHVDAAHADEWVAPHGTHEVSHEQLWWIHLYVQVEYEIPDGLDHGERRVSFLLDTEQTAAVVRRVIPEFSESARPMSLPPEIEARLVRPATSMPPRKASASIATVPGGKPSGDYATNLADVSVPAAALGPRLAAVDQTSPALLRDYQDAATGVGTGAACASKSPAPEAIPVRKVSKSGAPVPSRGVLSSVSKPAAKSSGTAASGSSAKASRTTPALQLETTPSHERPQHAPPTRVCFVTTASVAAGRSTHFKRHSESQQSDVSSPRGHSQVQPPRRQPNLPVAAANTECPSATQQIPTPAEAGEDEDMPQCSQPAVEPHPARAGADDMDVDAAVAGEAAEETEQVEIDVALAQDARKEGDVPSSSPRRSGRARRPSMREASASRAVDEPRRGRSKESAHRDAEAKRGKRKTGADEEVKDNLLIQQATAAEEACPGPAEEAAPATLERTDLEIEQKPQDPRPSGVQLTEEKVRAMKVDELRAELRRRHLNTNGKKAVLLKRLLSEVANTHEAEDGKEQEQAVEQVDEHAAEKAAEPADGVGEKVAEEDGACIMEVERAEDPCTSSSLPPLGQGEKVAGHVAEDEEDGADENPMEVEETEENGGHATLDDVLSHALSQRAAASQHGASEEMAVPMHVDGDVDGEEDAPVQAPEADAPRDDAKEPAWVDEAVAASAKGCSVAHNDEDELWDDKPQKSPTAPPPPPPQPDVRDGHEGEAVDLPAVPSADNKGRRAKRSRIGAMKAGEQATANAPTETAKADDSRAKKQPSRSRPGVLKSTAKTSAVSTPAPAAAPSPSSATEPALHTQDDATAVDMLDPYALPEDVAEGEAGRPALKAAAAALKKVTAIKAGAAGATMPDAFDEARLATASDKAPSAAPDTDAPAVEADCEDGPEDPRTTASRQPPQPPPPPPPPLSSSSRPLRKATAASVLPPAPPKVALAKKKGAAGRRVSFDEATIARDEHLRGAASAAAAAVAKDDARDGALGVFDDPDAPQKSESLPTRRSPEPGRLRPSRRDSMSNSKAPPKPPSAKASAKTAVAEQRRLGKLPIVHGAALKATTEPTPPVAKPRAKSPAKKGGMTSFSDASLLPWSSICDDHVLEVEREDRLARGKRKANEGLRASGVATDMNGIESFTSDAQEEASAPRPKRLHFERSPALHVADGASTAANGPTEADQEDEIAGLLETDTLLRPPPPPPLPTARPPHASEPPPSLRRRKAAPDFASPTRGAKRGRLDLTSGLPSIATLPDEIRARVEQKEAEEARVVDALLSSIALATSRLREKRRADLREVHSSTIGGSLKLKPNWNREKAVPI